MKYDVIRQHMSNLPGLNSEWSLCLLVSRSFSCGSLFYLAGNAPGGFQKLVKCIQAVEIIYILKGIKHSDHWRIASRAVSHSNKAVTVFREVV